jgi:GT2 family glycosyltransferase
MMMEHNGHNLNGNGHARPGALGAVPRASVLGRILHLWRDPYWGGLIRNILGVKIPALRQHAPRPLRIPAWYAQPPRTAPKLRISLVTPSYNQGRFLEATLRSVLEQEYSYLEYIVQDGGSTDESLDVIRRWQHRLAHWESVKDRGQAHAVNLGFRHATGDVMAWLNSDDLLLPGALAYVARYFERHPAIDVVYGHRLLIDHDGNEIGRWILPRHDNAILSWADYVPQETMFWRRRIWDKVGAAMDESFQFTLDWDLILRFRDARARFRRLPRFLGAFRIHPEQKTSAQRVTVGNREMQRLYERVHVRPMTALACLRQVLPYLCRHAVCERLYQLGLVRY